MSARTRHYTVRYLEMSSAELTTEGVCLRFGVSTPGGVHETLVLNVRDYTAACLAKVVGVLVRRRLAAAIKEADTHKQLIREGLEGGA